MDIRAFRALMPVEEAVARVACPPYDVIRVEEAYAIARDSEASFVRVIRPEVLLERGVDEHDPRVYEAGRVALDGLARSAEWVQEGGESLWVYRLTMGGRSQTGVFACVPVAAYDDGRIVRHEKTRVDKEDDRTRHIVTQRAHAEPVMLTYVDAEAVDRCVAAVVSGGEPRFRFEADDVVHEVWDVTDVESLRGAFEGVERVYVADGHHRCAAASRAAAELGEVEGVDIFPAVLFPMGQMKIWPYHRVVWDGGDDVLGRVRARVSVRAGQARPSGPGRVGMFVDGAWWELDLPETCSEDTAARLDVARLAEFVLGPVFGIEDPRTDRRLSFVGGIRGTGALEAAVVEEGASVAFSMWETSMEEFRAVSDAGELMPPKSTWFEPKLRSGILVHRFGEDDR